MAIRKASETLLGKEWLFVTLDSCRGEHLRNGYSNLREYLPENSKWIGSGILIEGSDILDLDEKAKIIVPFSAVYVVDKGILNLPKTYDVTSESEQFKATLPDDLRENLSRPGIYAYLADGCGLNYCFADDTLDIF